MIDSPIIPLFSIGLALVALFVLSGQLLDWIENNKGTVAKFLAALAALFLFVRFAPGMFGALRNWLCGCGG